MEVIADVKKGYKKTKIGLIPEDWEVVSLGDMGELVTGLTYSPKDIDESGILVLRSSNVQDRQLEFKDNVYVKVDNGSFNPVKSGDLLICVRNGSKSLIGKNALIDKKSEGVAFGAFMSIYRSAHNSFFYQLFDTDTYNREIHRNLGATINSINGKHLKKFLMPFPPLPEQQKIVAILGTWDKTIRIRESLLLRLTKRRKGLCQELLSGGIRFHEFVKSENRSKTKIGMVPKDWDVVPLSKILTRVKNPVSVDTDQKYREIGIRSHCKGIFHKEGKMGKELGNKSVFWIEPDCFVLNIVFAWEHAIAKTTSKEEGMIASHRFPMYRPKDNLLNLDYFLFYFQTDRGKHLLGLASPGGAGRNKTLGQAQFLKLKIPIPSLKEQERIAEVLLEADKEVDLIKKDIQALKAQKKGLMQQLLTGKKRVKTD